MEVAFKINPSQTAILYQLSLKQPKPSAINASKAFSSAQTLKGNSNAC